MEQEALNDLYEANPRTRERIANSVGYAVFSTIGTKIFLVGSGNGYGVAVDNQTKERTYMRLLKVSGGIGWGLKTSRLIFIFHDEKTLNTFIESGWEFGGDADAAAVVDGDTGATISARGSTVGGEGAISGSAQGGASEEDSEKSSVTTGAGLEVYQLTETGVALQAMVGGTKYYKDKKLN